MRSKIESGFSSASIAAVLLWVRRSEAELHKVRYEMQRPKAELAAASGGASWQCNHDWNWVILTQKPDIQDPQTE